MCVGIVPFFFFLFFFKYIPRPRLAGIPALRSLRHYSGESGHQSQLCRHEVIIGTVARTSAAHLVTHVQRVVLNNEQ